METSVQSFPLSKWEMEPTLSSNFALDRVAAAYLLGNTNLLSTGDFIYFEKLIYNFQSITHISHQAYVILNSFNIQPVHIFMRLNSWDNYSILIVIPESDFLNEIIIDVYDQISLIEESVSSNTFNATISFCDYTEHFDVSKVKNDGFILRLKT